ncbi:MAG: restriction endonuclease subunit S [Bacteroidetes bacterium]|nr:restriction endonuclease subunit S [Bacteroidota bacterium]
MSKENFVKDSGYELYLKLVVEKKKLISEKLILDKKDNHKYPIENAPFKIPKNWYWCYLSDISIIQEGPGIRKHQYQNEGIQFLTVTNILEDAIDLDKSKKYISLSEYEKTYSHFTINKGDIVTACSGGSWGKSAMFELDDTLILNTSTLRLRFYNDLGNNRYLYYLTKTSYFKDSLRSYITGQQPNYGYSHYSKIPIPLPPLPEQQRIVSILDECFTAIDKAKANAEQNLKNAKELFESYLQGVFEKLMGRTELTKLANHLDLITYGFTNPMPTTDEGPYMITAKNVNYGIVDYENARRTSQEAFDNLITDKSRPKVGDVLLTKDGTLGRLGVVEKESSCINQSVALLRPNENLNSYYLKVLLSSPFYQKLMIEQAGGATIKHIYITRVDKMLVPIPPLKEQQTIVRQLDVLRAETQKLEAVYQQKIDNLEELKKSILQKAFAGQLSSPEGAEYTKDGCSPSDKTIAV